MTEVIYKDNYKESQKELLRGYAKKPNWEDMLDILNEFSQELEDVFYDLMIKFNLNIAVGDQLDILGLIVGLRRFTVDDDVFRSEIKFKALTNRSAGELEFLQDALAHLANAIAVWIVEYPDKSAMSGYIKCDPADLPPDITAKMRDLVLGGAKYDYTNTAFDNVPFAFSVINIHDNLVTLPNSGGYAVIDIGDNLVTDNSGKYSVAV